MQGKQTATEIMELKKQSMMKMGYALFGILSFERQLSWLNLYLILDKWTKPVDETVDDAKQKIVDTYKQISIEEEDQYGKFTRVIDFNPEGLNKTPEQLDGEAEVMSTSDRAIQKVYLNSKILREKMLSWKFFIDITPTEKDTTELRSVLFSKRIAEAKTLFGLQSTNDTYLKRRYAILAKEDPEQFWAAGQPQMAMPAPEESAMMGNDVMNAMKKSVNAPSAPTINKAV